jgi:hypothetical protein
VYSRRLAIGNLAAAPADHTLFTVPAGHVYVVRWLTAWTDLAGNVALVELIGGARLRMWTADAANFSRSEEARFVFAAGETVNCHIFSGNWHVSAHGYDFAA